MLSKGPISEDIDRACCGSAGSSYDFEVEASKFALPEYDFTVESGDEIVTPGGTRTFDRAVRDADGMWTLLYRGGMSHGPGYLGMKVRQGEWQLQAEYEGVVDL